MIFFILELTSQSLPDEHIEIEQQIISNTNFLYFNTLFVL